MRKTNSISDPLGAISDRLMLPSELVLDDPILILRGQNHLTIENLKGIRSFDDRSVILHYKKGTIQISGESLSVSYYAKDEIRITGQINQITYQMVTV